MEKNRENLNNPNQDLTQDLNSILGLDTQLNTCLLYTSGLHNYCGSLFFKGVFEFGYI